MAASFLERRGAYKPLLPTASKITTVENVTSRRVTKDIAILH